MGKYSIETNNREEFEYFYQGPEYHSVLVNLYNELRSREKHSNEPGSWGESLKLLNNLLLDANIDLFN